MPCYTVQKYEVDAGRFQLHTLADGLELMGYSARVLGTEVLFTGNGVSGRYSQATGRFNSTGAQVDVGAVKVAYGRAAVAAAARKLGWRTEVNKQSNQRVTLRRRK